MPVGPIPYSEAYGQRFSSMKLAEYISYINNITVQSTRSPLYTFSNTMDSDAPGFKNDRVLPPYVDFPQAAVLARATPRTMFC